MATSLSIGAIELSSVAVGYRVQDALLKAATVDLLLARTICSGKYLLVFSGSVDDVKAAVAAGVAESGEAIIDQLMLPNVHPGVFPALSQSVVIDPAKAGSLGIVESFSGVSIIAAADAAAKAADVTIFRIHVAMALGGKGFCLMTGSLPDVTAGVSAAAEEVRKRGLLVADVVIPQPSPELLAEYI
jgi:microcompartment protein CcmL/EutN